MTDFFKSAFGYLGGGGGGLGGAGGAVSQDNDFVGQCVELGEQKLRVKRVIAEGERGPSPRAPRGVPPSSRKRGPSPRAKVGSAAEQAC